MLGPWLVALRTGRPAVIAAYMATDEAGECLGTRTLGELRAATDAVLFAGGRVKEGVPGSHGLGIVELPGTPLSGAPWDVLKMLYTAGVRLLLLAGGRPLAEEYADAGEVDRGLVFLPGGRESPLPPSSPTRFVLPGFRIERIMKTEQHARLDTLPRA